MCSAITFIGAEKKKGGTSDKASQAVLTNWVRFFGTPGKNMADNDAIFHGWDFQDFVMSATPLYRQLFLGIANVYELLHGEIGILKTYRNELKIIGRI